MNKFTYFEKVLKETGYYSSYSCKDFITDESQYYSSNGIRNSFKSIHIYLPGDKILLRCENEKTNYLKDFVLTGNFDKDVEILRNEIKAAVETKTGWQLCGNGCYVKYIKEA